MKILITGGAGCLGSSLIEKYLPEGHQISVIDNFATGNREVVPNLRNLTVIEGSIAEKELVDKCLNDFQPEVVIHSAAAYKDPSNWEEDSMTNIVGTINLAKACEKSGVKKVINFQTALCYGRPKQVPIPIDSAESPFTSYGISKTAGENYLINSGLEVISFRLANICGPRLSIGPIPTFYTRLKEGKNCFCSDTERDFLEMSDFLDLMDIALFNSEGITGKFNVSTGKGNSIKDVFDTVCEYLGLEVPDIPIVPAGDDDVPKVILDPTVTEKVFVWKAKHNFKTTINKQLEWYDKYGISNIYSHLSVPKT